MFILKNGDYTYELMYTECSRLVCTDRKKMDDAIKLWREINDGIFWARKRCNPEKEEFGIIGIQVAGMSFLFYFIIMQTVLHKKKTFIGDELLINVLIRDLGDVHRLYNLKSVKIPVQQTDKDTVTGFIEALLVLRVCYSKNTIY